MNKNLTILNETLEAFEQGYYKKGMHFKNIKLSKEDLQEASVYLPDEQGYLHFDATPLQPLSQALVTFTTKNTDSLHMALKRMEIMKQEDPSTQEKVLVLNFANAFHPGGGVRYGANAQEEDLCRKSSLLLSLESEDAKEYYHYHENLHSNLGSNALIYSPNVEVIKDEDGNFLDDSKVISVVSCAAPNLAYGYEGLSYDAYEQRFYARIQTILHFAAANHYKHLVLGAFGCGAFLNDAQVVSELFYEAMHNFHYGKYALEEVFDTIDFAVLSKDGYNYEAFHKYFTTCNYYDDMYVESVKQALMKKKTKQHYLNKVQGCMMAGAFADFKANRNSLSSNTQIMLFIANALLYHETQTKLGYKVESLPNVIKHTLLEWKQTQILDQPNPMQKNDNQITWLLACPEVYKHHPQSILSSILCVLSVALHPVASLAEMIETTKMVSTILDKDTLDQTSCLFMNVIIYHIIYKEETIDNSIKESLQTLKAYGINCNELYDVVSVIQDYDEIKNKHSMYEEVILACYYALHPKETMKDTISCCLHESNLTIALVGYMLGASNGYKAISMSIEKDFELHDIIYALSSDLCYGCDMQKDHMYNDVEARLKYTL